jgi:hypothetical protein
VQKHEREDTLSKSSGGGSLTMSNSTISAPVIEGTWEEVMSQATQFQGHRLRVVILPDEPVTGKYAARMRPLLAQILTEESSPEKDQQEKELQELMNALNENRRRDGAEPIF